MINIVKAKDRHFTDMGWLKTYWLFSFSNYYDPENVSHGAIRVFNDDVVAPHTGFGTHPHEEMEIISIVLAGEMVHKDTMGNEIVIRAGDVQRMTAGTGLRHSEQNTSGVPVHFYQIWIYPDKPGLAPSYDQKNFKPETWQNRLALLASARNEEDAVRLNTDGALYRAALDKGRAVNYTTGADRSLFVYVIDGAAAINGETMEKNDQARISAKDSLQINAFAAADFLLIDVPASRG
jgi:redox-sensitive bicupin YhaK (pirin superfamily)